VKINMPLLPENDKKTEIAPAGLPGLQALRLAHPEYEKWDDKKLMSSLRKTYTEYDKWDDNKLDNALVEKFTPAKSAFDGIREQYPEYKDWDDDKLRGAFKEKFDSLPKNEKSNPEPLEEGLSGFDARLFWQSLIPGASESVASRVRGVTMHDC